MNYSLPSNQPFAQTQSQPRSRWHWLTRIALLLLLALVSSRVLMLEILREPIEVTPGSPAIPRGPGPAISLLLDLLCTLPALLILLRSSLDPTYRIRRSWSYLPMSLLGITAILSPLWAADKFAAAVSAANFFAALVVLWATSQLVRDWLHLRIVTAISTGLLLALLTQGFIYHFVELPTLQQVWEQQRSELLKQRGWENNSFTTRQFENRVLSGEAMGFNASPNSFGALLVLLSIIVVGLLIQRIVSRDEPGWWITLIILLALSGWMIAYTRSRTAGITPLLALLGFLLLWRFHAWITKNSRLSFFIALSAITLAVIAIIAHGMYHGTLFHNSLTFRWRYWVGSWPVFLHHPWLGVGWENFSLYYLAHRLPIASEEIKDPHNILVRFFIELGLVGGILFLLWILRLARELTRPLPTQGAEQSDAPNTSPFLPWQQGLAFLSSIASLAIFINILASVDLTQSADYIFVEIIRRLLLLCAIILGGAIVLLHDSKQPRLDDRPAPWLLYGLLLALALFLLHNLIDFSFFEIGPMFLSLLLAGAALGMHLSPSPRSRPYLALTSLLLGTLSLIFATIFFIAPIICAEKFSQSADENFRNNRFPQAAAQYQQAFYTNPLIPNSAYAFNAARAMFTGNAPSQPILSLLDIAIQTNPQSIHYYLWRANFLLNRHEGSPDQILADFTHALSLNPSDISARLRYADTLIQFGMPLLARHEYQQALHYNDQLEPADPKRLSPSQIQSIQQKISALTP